MGVSEGTHMCTTMAVLLHCEHQSSQYSSARYQLHFIHSQTANLILAFSGYSFFRPIVHPYIGNHASSRCPTSSAIITSTTSSAIATSTTSSLPSIPASASARVLSHLHCCKNRMWGHMPSCDTCTDSHPACMQAWWVWLARIWPTLVAAASQKTEVFWNNINILFHHVCHQPHLPLSLMRLAKANTIICWGDDHIAAECGLTQHNQVCPYSTP